MDEKFQKKKFSVIHPPWDQNADSLIKEIISKQTDLRRFFVVSSDHEIRSFARSKRAKSINCKEFNRELKTALKENKKFMETQKKVVSLSPLEISQWFEIFSSKK